MKRFFVLCCLVVVVSSQSNAAENWPAWRGPTYNSISTAKNIPAVWSKEKNIAWRLKLPGKAGATPVVWGDNIFLTSADDKTKNLLLICVGTDGKKRWEKQVGTGDRKVGFGRRAEGNMASPSPCTDGKHVWCFFGTGDLACFDFEGNRIWKTNIQDRYGKFIITYGMSSTPLLYENLLILQVIHGEMRKEGELAYIVALDKMTGKEIWKHDRHTKAETENKHSYTSPMLYDDGKNKFFVTHGGDYIIGHDLKTGEEIWRCGGLNPHDDPNKQYHPTLRFVASPTVYKNTIVVPTAKGQGMIVIRPGDARGDITDKKKYYLWKQKSRSPDVPCPLVYDGLVYNVTRGGQLYCKNLKNGNDVYGGRQGVRTHRLAHRASPVYADGKIFIPARDGVVTVIKAGRKFEMIAQNKIEETLTASPVIVGETLYLRTYKALYAIRNLKSDTQ